MPRVAEVERNTKETQIGGGRDRDGTGRGTIATGVGFFDHMLDSFARHGGFDLEVETRGDLHIDMHHTVEDTGIVIGQAVHQALDGLKGVRRCGHAYIPMDWTLTRCAGDLSNRTYLSARGRSCCGAWAPSAPAARRFWRVLASAKRSKPQRGPAERHSWAFALACSCWPRAAWSSARPRAWAGSRATSCC